jgi:hypothetical protein
MPPVPADGGAGHFLVTSSGHAGTIWLAGSLNLHDDVCATVGIGHPLQCFSRYALNKDVSYMTERAGHELIEYGFHTPTGYMPAVHGADTAKERDTWKLPWYVFDELALVPAPRPYKFIGNVHGVVLAHVFAAWQSDPELFRGRHVAVMELIRHPVPRIESAINATAWLHLEESEPAISAFLHANAQECLELERRYAVDFAEPRARAALIVYRLSLQNDAWAAEIRDYPDIHRISLERLQAEPEYYASVFYALTQGRLIADQGYLDRVFTPENLASGRQSTPEHVRPLGPRAQYERWSAWEREEFACVTQRLNLPRLYFPFGYDFSFVERGTARNGSWFSEMLS